MAKLSLDLSQFKAAGVYTVEVDQSERITVTTQSLRLVVGFSKIGPFNAPTFIRSTRDRARFFGDIDKKLEKKGSFFQRSIDTCLLQAPVFALNLLNLASVSNPDASGAVAAEYTGFASLSLDSSIANKGVYTDKYINFFNRERFWKPDPDYLLGVAGNKEGVPGSAESTSLLQVANVGTKRVSVIVRKAVGLQGYDVTAKDWYGSTTAIPYEWIRPYDQMKNYFIQVIAIEGDWTNYTGLSVDPFFSAYFNANGVIPSKFNEFINLPQVSLIGSWIGTFIPDFRDQTGANQNIEDIVNASVSLTGILVNVNQDALDQLIWDETSQQWEMGDGSSTEQAAHVVDLVGHNLIDKGVTGIGISYDQFLTPSIVANSSTLFSDASALIPADVSLLITMPTHAITTTYTIGDVSVFVSDASYFDTSIYYDASGNTVTVRIFTAPEVVNASTLYPTPPVSVQSPFLSYDISVANPVIHSTLPIYTFTDSTGKNFKITATNKDLVTVGTLIRRDQGDGLIGVTYVTNKTFDGSLYAITTAEPIYNYLTNPSEAYLQKPIDDASIATHYKFLQLNGLRLTSNHLPGYTIEGSPNAEEGVIKIYEMLEDQGILRGLTNPEMINYRYVVDTMAYGLRHNLGGKVYLSRLAKKRGKTTAIISAPSMTQFSTSQDPYFCDVFVSGVDPKPIFSTEYIPVGGNPDMPRSFRFTLPDEDNGSKFTGVFGPFLKYTENDKVILVPPAADISNSFVRKFLGGDPYAIVANKNGIISNPNLAGVEYMLDKEDRSYLEPFGYNSIIERTSTGEVLIYANRTAYQTVKSDFNYLHVRELLNTIELQVEEVLKNYVFDFNNPVTRLTIINAVTPILESMKDAGALINYQITMDESNNTPDVVDEGLAIIDIGVWVTKGMEKIIQRITVYKTGGVSTGSNSTL